MYHFHGVYILKSWKFSRNNGNIRIKIFYRVVILLKTKLQKKNKNRKRELTTTLFLFTETCKVSSLLNKKGREKKKVNEPSYLP